MSLPGIAIGPGISVGAGISIGTGTNTVSITINPSDFTNGGGAGGTGAYITPSGGDLYCPLYWMNTPNGSISTDLINFFSTCGYDVNTSYVFHATFASATVNGTTTSGYSCLVRASWNTNAGEFDMVVIDQSNPGWQTGNPNSGTQLQGTFTLPVTLSPYTPTVSTGPINWC